MQPVCSLQVRRLAIVLACCMSMVSPTFAAPKKDEAPTPPAPTAPPGQLVPDMTIKLLTIGNYKSGSSKKGERVNLRVDEDVMDANGTVLVRKGTAAYGTVTASRSSGIFGKRGLLDVSIDYTTAVDGTRVPLRANKARSGKSNTGVSVAAVILLAPVALFVKGSNVTLKEGTPILAYVDDVVKVGAGGGPVTASMEMTGPPKTLTLRNGDKITGHIQDLSGGVYTVATASGTLKIKSDEVESIIDAEKK